MMNLKTMALVALGLAAASVVRIPINSDTYSSFIRTGIPILTGHLFRFYSDSHRSDATLGNKRYEKCPN
jgi:uncharacterized protein YraI